MSANAGDRRAFPRVPTDVPVQIHRPDHFASAPIPARMLDISQNGALLLTTVPIPQQEWIVIQPDMRGAGYGTEISLIVEEHLPADKGQVKLACSCPEPVDYSVLRLFMH